ncbi:MAG: hypothetical protein WCJ62_13755, partial [Flavobacterium sp.]
MTDRQNSSVKQTIIMNDYEAFPSYCEELGECYEGHGYLNGDQEEGIDVYWEITSQESDNMDEHVDNWDKPLYANGRHISEFNLILAHETDKISAYLNQMESAPLQADEAEQVITISQYAVGDLIR